MLCRHDGGYCSFKVFFGEWLNPVFFGLSHYYEVQCSVEINAR